MLEAIEVINFQSHEETTLELHPGVNVIKGTSHKGKSAFMRALELLFFNVAPGRGIAYKNWNAKKEDLVEIAVSFKEGTWVSRVFDEKSNPPHKYISDGIELKALKSGDVPDEVKAITQIDRINFQTQGDKFFLIGDTPGIAGKKLNALVGLQIIDESKTKINQKIKDIEKTLEIAKSDLKETEQKLKGYGHVKQAERLVNRIEGLDRQMNEMIDRQFRINSISAKVLQEDKKINELNKWLKVKKDYSKLNKQYIKLKETRNKFSKLLKFTHEITHSVVIIETKGKVLELKPDLIKLKKQYSKFKESTDRYDRVVKICNSIIHQNNIIQSKNSILETQYLEREKLREQLNYCQYCGAEKKHWRKNESNKRKEISS